MAIYEQVTNRTVLLFLNRNQMKKDRKKGKVIFRLVFDSINESNVVCVLFS